MLTIANTVIVDNMVMVIRLVIPMKLVIALHLVIVAVLEDIVHKVMDRVLELTTLVKVMVIASHKNTELRFHLLKLLNAKVYRRMFIFRNKKFSLKLNFVVVYFLVLV